MKSLRTIAATFLMLSLALVPISSSATTPCSTEITDVQAALLGVMIGGGKGDGSGGGTRAGLEKKLTDAVKKLGEDKFADALQKLLDFREKVIQLRDANKPKIEDGTTTVDQLLTDVGAAIACVEGLL